MQPDRRLTRRTWTLLGLLALVSASAVPAVAASVDRPLAVWVTVLPQREIVERVGGDVVRVEVLVEPSRSPETYAPTSRQLSALLEADLFVRIGIPFERSLVSRIQELAPQLRVVDGREGLELMPAPAGHASHHRDGGEHAHDDVDPHVWLDPAMVVQQATVVCQALCMLDSERCAGFRDNLARYQSELEDLDRRLGTLLEPYRDRSFLVFHPAYGYLARRYHLRQLAVEVDGKDPTPRQLSTLVEKAQAADVRVLFVQPQFAGRGADAAARALGAEVAELDPLAPDLLANLERMARRIAASLEG